jgi:hypothetical protein
VRLLNEQGNCNECSGLRVESLKKAPAEQKASKFAQIMAPTLAYSSQWPMEGDRSSPDGAGEIIMNAKGIEMSELEQLLSGDGAAAPPAFILERLSAEEAMRSVTGAPRTIYEELWHVAFWQQISIDWIGGKETQYPAHAEEGFPTEAQRQSESCRRSASDFSVPMRRQLPRRARRAGWKSKFGAPRVPDILCGR